MNIKYLLSRKYLNAVLVAAGMCAMAPSAYAIEASAWDLALSGAQRSHALKSFDSQRYPKEFLQFFDVQPQKKLIEVWPNDGWLTEILAPLLKENGRLIFAIEPNNSAEHAKLRTAFLNKLADDPDTYGDAAIVTFDPAKSDIRPVGGVDLVISFGNVQTWVKEGTAEKAFAAFYRALKSGGVLGIVNTASSTELSNQSVIELAKAAGFSEIGQRDLSDNGPTALRFSKPVNALVPDDVVRTIN